MPVVLLGIGVFAVVAGLAMIGFGIPINEFSFGNTLISAGTTAAVGGLVIIAIGVAVGQLRRIAGMLADPANARLPLPLDELEPASAHKSAGLGPAVAPAIPPAPGRGPQRTKERPVDRQAPDPFAIEPEPPPFGERADQSFAAPSLRNPDDAALTVDDDISLSPRHPQGAPAPAALPPGSLDRTSDSFDWRVPPPGPNAPGAPPPKPGNFDANPAARPQPANFDAMWPAESKAAKPPSSGAPSAAPRLEPKPDAPKRADAEKPRTVAILKSGVVDGMGYTLYVDGSIEAELPQGTLRFASINELRSHLEKNS